MFAPMRACRASAPRGRQAGRHGTSPAQRRTFAAAAARCPARNGHTLSETDSRGVLDRWYAACLSRGSALNRDVIQGDGYTKCRAVPLVCCKAARDGEEESGSRRAVCRSTQAASGGAWHASKRARAGGVAAPRRVPPRVPHAPCYALRVSGAVAGTNGRAARA